jgi:epoxyqueuosine reductase
MKRLLLHICCAPCALVPLERLRPGYDVSGFFYNPNIHPAAEYRFRTTELQTVSGKLDQPVIWGEYDFRSWFNRIRGLEGEPERGRRCDLCFRMRLERTFVQARDDRFEVVTTTLTSGSQKEAARINRIGNELAARFKIDFLAADFKKRGGVELTRRRVRELGVRVQNYCGCVYSLVDRWRRTHRPSEADPTCLSATSESRISRVELPPSQ